MGASKTEKFDTYQNDLAEIAKAIAHPARIAILQYLAQASSCVCGDIVDHLPLSQSTVSQHLKALKSAGIIQGSIDGPTVCYCIHDATWSKAKNMLSTFFESYDALQKDCC